MIRRAAREPAGCYQQCAFCRLAIRKGDLCVHLRALRPSGLQGLATICLDCAEVLTHATQMAGVPA